MQQGRVKVEILNQIYTINGDASPEYILELADYIDSKMREIYNSNTSCTPMQAAILAAMNIADEYFQMKKICSNFDGIFGKKTEAIISMLDENLIGDVSSNIHT